MTKYTITGKDKADKRFVINTDTPQHYNIWDGKRKLVTRVIN